MNPPSDTPPPPPAETPGARSGMEEASPANWIEALMALISSRIALIQYEARESAKSGVKRVVRWLLP
jgi:type VI protein secretion system component VasF